METNWAWKNQGKIAHPREYPSELGTIAFFPWFSLTEYIVFFPVYLISPPYFLKLENCSSTRISLWTWYDRIFSVIFAYWVYLVFFPVYLISPPYILKCRPLKPFNGNRHKFWFYSYVLVRSTWFQRTKNREILGGFSRSWNRSFWAFLAGAEAEAAELEQVFSQLHGTGAGAGKFFFPERARLSWWHWTSSETLLSRILHFQTKSSGNSKAHVFVPIGRGASP